MTSDDAPELDLRGARVIRHPAPVADAIWSDEVQNIYTNSTLLRISVHDLILSFGVAEPYGEETKTRMVARVFMSPQHAKVLTKLLQNHLRLYEATFGPIPGDVKDPSQRAAKPDDAEETEG